MKLSTYRPKLILWLKKYIAISTEELHDPEAVGQTSLFVPPLRTFRHFDGGADDPIATAFATQEIYIRTRYDKALKYVQLPISTVEGAYSTISQLLLRDYRSIADLLDLNIVQTDDAVEVSKVGENKADWLITLKIVFNIKWIPELEAGYIVDPGFYNRLSLGIYRAKQNSFDVKVLDFRKDFP